MQVDLMTNQLYVLPLVPNLRMAVKCCHSAFCHWSGLVLLVTKTGNSRVAGSKQFGRDVAHDVFVDNWSFVGPTDWRKCAFIIVYLNSINRDTLDPQMGQSELIDGPEVAHGPQVGYV